MIKNCNCKSSQQDTIYGKNKRVFNPTDKRDGSKHVFRCTVCLKELKL